MAKSRVPVKKTAKKSVANVVKAARSRERIGDGSPPHLIVEARAGTGKTTTLIEGLKRVKGIVSKLVPSPQQAAVWAAMEAGRDEASRTVCFVAFNKSIATELQRRVPQGCESMTMHSMGLKAVAKAFGQINVNSFRVQDIIAEILERDIRDIRRNDPVLLHATEELVGLCKMNLVGTDTNPHRGDWMDEDGFAGALAELASYYDVELNGQASRVFDLVPRVLERCRDVPKDRCIDFNDMIWLPVALNLPVFRYDLLLVDEAQDLNRCQQQLALKAGRRLVLCGDPRQAIYGFAGADTESMNRMQEILCETGRGCERLYLTVTRRCGKAIVAEAQRIVPDFAAFDSNPEGTVRSHRFRVKDNDTKPHTDQLDYRSSVKPGDMILSRVNAPLVSECLMFLRQGRKAGIQGRDVGEGLVKTIKKLCKPAEPSEVSVSDIVVRIGDWLRAETEAENRKRNPSEARIINLGDRHDCIVAFCEEVGLGRLAQEVIAAIQRIFSDDNGEGIRLSSIHKAKGLESSRVFLLRTKAAPVPHPMAKTSWQREQENNLLYVAVTRAINELVYVVD